MKLSLVVGINDYQNVAYCPPLNGPLNDIVAMSSFLHSSIGAESVTISQGEANASNILSALKTSASQLHAGDQLILYYSGHGCPFPFQDVVHDGLCPVDFDWTRSNVVLDTDISAALVSLPPGSRCTIIADSCYSGGLQPNYKTLLATAMAPSHRIRTIPIPGNIAAEIERIRGMNAVTTLRAVLKPLNVVLLAACAPEGEAGDAVIDGRYTGVLTHFLLKHLNSDGTLNEVAQATATKVGALVSDAGYPQVPELHGNLSLFTLPLLL
jgi:hypothetical protein